MKDKLKKNIVRICLDKFKREGTLTGITAEQKDQFYSELYLFMIKESRSELQKQVFLLNKRLFLKKKT